VFIFVMVVMFTGLMGLLVLLVATAVGLVPQALGVRRSHAMGVLLLPVIIMLW
jgi:putative membrane protein